MAGWADGDPLGIRIRAAFGADLTADPATWTWTDITSYWYAPASIDLEWGRQPGADRAEPSTCALTLRNTDGRFTSGNSLSPYWPHVRKWAVPLEVDIDLGDGAGWRNKHSGTVRSWPVTWPGRSDRLVLARIESVGILGRLGRGTPPARSPMRRTIAATSPLAYWPAEDGGTAGVAGSAVDGVAALGVVGTTPFVTLDQLVWPAGITYGQDFGTAAVADLSGGAVLSGRVPTSVTDATTTAWTVTVSSEVPAYTDLSGDLVLMDIATPGGTYVRWQLVFSAASDTQSVIAYDSAGAATTVMSSPTYAAAWYYHSLSVWQDGATIQAGVEWSEASSAYADTGSVAGTLAGITQVVVNPSGVTSGSTPMPVGHIALWAEQPMPVPQGNTDSYGVLRDGPLLSWHNEAAHLRIARLAAEDGVTLTAPTVSDASMVMRMGTQPAASRLDLYAEVERTDLGLLYEDGHGLAYLPRSDRYNQAVALTIDASARQLGGDLAPVDDDQRYRDRWTVSRDGGSSAVAGDGDVEGSTQVSLPDDSTLTYHASWRLWLFGGPGVRYPQLSMPLHTQAGRGLAADWVACRPGSRVQVVNAPAAAPGSTIDQVIVGARETIVGRRSWRVVMATEPADRWDVAVADGTARVGADGSTLDASLTSSALSLSLASTAANGVWTTDPAHFPMDLRIGGYGGTGGERVTVSAISGTSSPQTVTITARAVNGVSRAWDAGTSVDVWDRGIVAL